MGHRAGYGAAMGSGAGTRNGTTMGSGAGTKNGTAMGRGTPMGRGAGMGLHGARHRMLGAAASYLGVPPRQLVTDLRSGKSLVEIAKANHRSVSGLKAVLIAQASRDIDRLIHRSWKAPTHAAPSATTKSTGKTSSTGG